MWHQNYTFDFVFKKKHQKLANKKPQMVVCGLRFIVKKG